MAGLRLERNQILAYRRSVTALDRRLLYGSDSLHTAAWAGLQDSMPRAAVLSIHARVADTQPSTWDDDSLVQVWGPRFSVFVVAAPDLAVFTVGRTPHNEHRRDRADDFAKRIAGLLGDQRMRYGEVAKRLGEQPNALRYATTTGTVVIHWDGARQPEMWSVPEPTMSVEDARKELARRYLHVFGPTTPSSYAGWAGIRGGEVIFEWLSDELSFVSTPMGDGWILDVDEPALTADYPAPEAVRLIPSGDSYILAWGRDRDLLVPDTKRQAMLWTSRVWPGAVLVDGEIVGTWRRSKEKVTIECWDEVSRHDRERVENEAGSFPLPDLTRPMEVIWT